MEQTTREANMLPSLPETAPRLRDRHLDYASLEEKAAFRKIVTAGGVTAARSAQRMPETKTHAPGTSKSDHQSGGTRRGNTARAKKDGDFPTYIIQSPADVQYFAQTVHDVFTPPHILAQQQRQAHIISLVPAPLMAKFTSQALFQILTEVQARLPMNTPNFIQAAELKKELEQRARPWYMNPHTVFRAAALGVVAATALYNLGYSHQWPGQP